MNAFLEQSGYRLRNPFLRIYREDDGPDGPEGPEDPTGNEERESWIAAGPWLNFEAFLENHNLANRHSARVAA